MASFIHLLLVAFIFVAAKAADCPEYWALFQDSCYSLGADDGFSFYSARDDCESEQAYLAEITSEEENEFVKDLIREEIYDDETSVWIGLSQGMRGNWKLEESDEDADFTDWAGPSKRRVRHDWRCGVMSRDQDWSWEDKSCGERDSSRTYVCEKRQPQKKQCSEQFCYEALERAASYYEDAKWMCDRIGAKVVEIRSEEVNNFFTKFLDAADLPSSDVWIGAVRGAKNTFQWDKWDHSGSELVYDNWNWDQPDNSGVQGRPENCVVASRDKGWKWNDVMCEPPMTEASVVCESPASQ